MANETLDSSEPQNDPGESDQNPEEKPKRKRGMLNQEYSDELAKTRRILSQALRPEYAAILVKQEVEPELITKLPEKVKLAEQLIAAALKGTADVGDAQEEREEFRDDLIEAIEPIRAAAKRKYRRTATDRLKTYFVGEPLETNKADLDATATAILGQLQGKNGAAPLDTLPGIKAAEITALADALAAYRGPDATEERAQGTATGSRMSLGQVIRNLRNDRIEIQLAVEQAYPWRNPENAKIRTVFELPLDRPLNE